MNKVDCIDRAKAIYIASGYCHPANIADELRKLPSVVPQPRTGHWIEVTNGRGRHECDVCHDYAPSFQNGDEYLSPFCPNCSARMVDVPNTNVGKLAESGEKECIKN